MAVKVNMRLLAMDGTPEGTVLNTYEDVPLEAIPPEGTKLRSHIHEGLYRVMDDGILYYFLPNEVRITVVVQRVDAVSEE